MGRYMIPVCAICGKQGKYFNDRDSFISIDICNECYFLYEKLIEMRHFGHIEITDKIWGKLPEDWIFKFKKGWGELNWEIIKKWFRNMENWRKSTMSKTI